MKIRSYLSKFLESIEPEMQSICWELDFGNGIVDYLTDGTF